MHRHPDTLDVVASLRAQGEPFVLATVVRTVSVTAAKAGAKAVIRPDGGRIIPVRSDRDVVKSFLILVQFRIHEAQRSTEGREQSGIGNILEGAADDIEYGKAEAPGHSSAGGTHYPLDQRPGDPVHGDQRMGDL